MRARFGMVDTLLGAALGAWLSLQTDMWQRPLISAVVVVLMVIIAVGLHYVNDVYPTFVRVAALGLTVAAVVFVLISLRGFLDYPWNRLLPFIYCMGGWLLYGLLMCPTALADEE